MSNENNNTHNRPYDWDALREQRIARLSPQQAMLLKMVSMGGAQSFSELGVAGFRKLMSMDISALHSTGGKGDNVTSQDVKIPGPARAVPARIYKPEGLKEPAGVYVHFHHGGFVGAGGLTPAMDNMNTLIASKAGCIVVHPDFRLPPENKFPASVEDCWATYCWVSDNAKSFGGDPARLAVGGGCTGGTHSAAVALMARDAGMKNLKLQWLQDALLDARGDYQSHEENAKGYLLTAENNDWVLDRYLKYPEQRWDWRVSPVLAESVRGVAPAVIVAGEWDILRDEMKFYANRLRDAGVPVEFHLFENDGHGVGAVTPESGKKVHEIHIASLRRAFG